MILVSCDRLCVHLPELWLYVYCWLAIHQERIRPCWHPALQSPTIVATGRMLGLLGNCRGGVDAGSSRHWAVGAHLRDQLSKKKNETCVTGFFDNLIFPFIKVRHAFEIEAYYDLCYRIFFDFPFNESMLYIHNIFAIFFLFFNYKKK